MPKAISITRHESDTRGRYEARVDGIEGVGQLTYSRLSPDKIIAEHTSVDDSLRGTGVGEALVVRLIEDARVDGRSIFPLCPFVKAQYAKHPEWSDVIDS